jgi:ferredoxin-type protein NapG/ferredoxin-type protein NapH
MNDHPGDRRGFLRRAFGGAVEQIARATEERIVQRRYVRPPGALPEVAFLAACSRCGICTDVCPPKAIRNAGPEGGLASGTPYLLPDQVACIACPEMPCAANCPTGALLVPPGGWQDERLGRVVFHPDRCVTFRGEECRICVEACPIGEAALATDDAGRPILRLEGCVGCGVCVRSCPTFPSSFTVVPLER